MTYGRKRERSPARAAGRRLPARRCGPAPVWRRHRHPTLVSAAPTGGRTGRTPGGRSMRFHPRPTLLAGLVLAIGLFAGSATAQIAADDVKACWIYVGPVGDYGFSYAHDLGRQATVADLPGIETAYVEAVAEPDVEATVDQLVADGCNVIFGTSFGFGDGLLAAAERYPDVIFGHATGIERAPNVLTYMADFYQVYYANGLVAGALSES